MVDRVALASDAEATSGIRIIRAIVALELGRDRPAARAELADVLGDAPLADQYDAGLALLIDAAGRGARWNDDAAQAVRGFADNSLVMLGA